jgi:hypothetical protein
LAASDVNCAIAEKSLVNEEAEIATAAAELELELEVLGLAAGVLLPQAERASPAVKASTIGASDSVAFFLVTRFK